MYTIADVYKVDAVKTCSYQGHHSGAKTDDYSLAELSETRDSLLR